MFQEDFQQLIQNIVSQACSLKNKYTGESAAPVNYACIFTQSQAEYEHFLRLAEGLGKAIENTQSGPLFQIEPLETTAGPLKLLKIRIADPTRPERGDADFTLADYPAFKEKYLAQPGFKLIPRDGFEMIELVDPKFNVRCYFSNPPLDQQLGI